MIRPLPRPANRCGVAAIGNQLGSGSLLRLSGADSAHDRPSRPKKEVHPPMIRDFDALEEVRKHPGVTAGGLALIVLGAAAALYLSQRTGPTRYQRIKSRMNPRGWIDTSELRDRFHDAMDAFRHGAEDFGDRAGDYARQTRYRAADAVADVRDHADDWFRSARKGSSKALKSRGKTARRYADEAAAYARDHRREGGALLAVATLAAVVGAAVLESRRPDSRVRRIVRF